NEVLATEKERPSRSRALHIDWINGARRWNSPRTWASGHHGDLNRVAQRLQADARGRGDCLRKEVAAEGRPSGYLAGHWEQAAHLSSLCRTDQSRCCRGQGPPLAWISSILSPASPAGLFYGCCFTLARRTRKYFSACCPSIAVSGCLQTLQWI